MAVQIQIRRDTAANWTSTNPTLAAGEFGYETNTGLLKMGNGLDDWVTLDYFASGDVLGPAGATDGNLAVYDGVTGLLIKDGGAVPSAHDEVTLDADAANILDLTGQEIGLDIQTANTILAGPATGAADEPDFRALVAADLGSGSPTGSKFLKDDLSWSVPTGAGDVVGPAGATDGHRVVFDGATGKLIKDGGAITGVGDVLGNASVTDGHLAVFDGDGYHIKDGGAPGAGGGADLLEVQVFS
jgi:hypothetical protein